MPELPEVETIRQGLDKYLPGRKVMGYEILREKSFPNDLELAQQFMVGAHITSVKRRAKLLFINLSSGYTLAVHLKMTGQLIFQPTSGSRFGGGHPTDSLIGKLPDKSTRVILHLEDAKLYFNDQRVFGWMKLLPTGEIPNMRFVQKLGPEPLEQGFTKEVFLKRLMRRKNSNIKAALLDQTTVAGLGNIYTDEALWLSKIHPETKVKDITEGQIDALYHAIPLVLSEGLDKGGSTDRNYVNAAGEKGSYLDFAKVFRREGQHCQRCGGEILKIRVAGRGTHLCPDCQKKKA